MGGSNAQGGSAVGSAVGSTVGSAVGTAVGFQRWKSNPQPQPNKFTKLVSLIEFVLHVSELFIWGSSRGLGLRFHRSGSAAGAERLRGGGGPYEDYGQFSN